jgi:hypothetical protein
MMRVSLYQLVYDKVSGVFIVLLNSIESSTV